jgi:ketosteroid isomerase-like protein
MLRVPQRSRLVRALFWCLIVLAPGFAPGLAAQRAGPHHPNKLARQGIEELEQQWKNATVKGDVTAMDHLLSEDYVGISWTGQVNTKEMQLDRLRTRTSVVRQMELSDFKIKIVGPVAIVTSRADIQATSDDRDISGAYRYTRVYQRTPAGAWQITNFESTRIPNGQHDPDHMHRPPPPPPLSPSPSPS